MLIISGESAANGCFYARIKVSVNFSGRSDYALIYYRSDLIAWIFVKSHVPIVYKNIP